MKVAFATNDRKTIADRTGRAKEFAVYELSDSEVINIEYFENTHEHHEHKHGYHVHGKGHGHSHKDIIDKISTVDFLYAKHIGTHLKANLDEANIKFELTKEKEIDELIKGFLDDEYE